MEKLKAEIIARAVNGELIKGCKDTLADDICIDSRVAKAGDIFFAIIGEFNDGHKFMKSAYDSGCRIMIISDPDRSSDVGDDCSLILVDDSLYALQELAKWYLARFDMKKIAVTGSVGKTTTRDMIYGILKRNHNTGTSKANLNSETGTPMTLLSFDSTMEAAVIEMGMDGLGQISRLTDIAGPDIAVITNIGFSHMEKLGSRENIFRAKMEITEGFTDRNTLVVNADDDKLSEVDKEKVAYRIVKAGKAVDADFRVDRIEDNGQNLSFRIIHANDSFDVKLPIPGEHNAVNAALAAAACYEAGMKLDDIVKGLQAIKMTGSRLNVINAGGIRIIDDAYNASPESMLSAIKTLNNGPGKRKIAILAGMNELGDISEKEHEKLGMKIADFRLDLVITLGEKGKQIAKGCMSAGMDKSRLLHFDSRNMLSEQMGEILQEGDTVLLKASRSFELEKLVDSIKKIYAQKEG